jgi:hypothetical protein
MNLVTAIATDPRTGQKVEAEYKSWANDLHTQYQAAARAIEQKFGFKPDPFTEVSFRF